MAALARDHGGPTVTAVVLALLSVVPVALTFFTASGPAVQIDEVERLVPTPLEAVAVIAITLVLTAVASGSVGGFVYRRFRVTGAAVALVLAWLLGALLLPVVAALLGVELRTAVICFDTCSATLDTATPTATLLAVLVGMTIVTVTVIGGLVALALVAVAAVAARRGHPGIAIGALATALAVLNLLAFVLYGGAFVPYLCLAVGILAWDRWLTSRAKDTAGAEVATD